MTRGTEELQRRYPLCPGWAVPELIQDLIDPAGVEIHRVGWIARGPQREEATGSAAQTKRSPLERGYFELLERTSVLEAMRERRARYRGFDADGAPTGDEDSSVVFPESPAPQRWRYARSNGVALHDDWREASLRARWELVERDRVLRAWYGHTRPQPVALPTGLVPTGLRRMYEWEGSVFPAPSSDPLAAGESVTAAGVFGFPRHESLPLVWGCGARDTLPAALRAAAIESLQRLAFLWGEPLPAEEPPFEPNPHYHLERYLNPARQGDLRRWVRHGNPRRRARSRPRRAPGIRFIDLTPPALKGRLSVVKAVCQEAVPLVFGEAPDGLADHLPVNLRVHPVA